MATKPLFEVRYSINANFWNDEPLKMVVAAKTRREAINLVKKEHPNHKISVHWAGPFGK